MLIHYMSNTNYCQMPNIVKIISKYFPYISSCIDWFLATRKQKSLKYVDKQPWCSDVNRAEPQLITSKTSAAQDGVVWCVGGGDYLHRKLSRWAVILWALFWSPTTQLNSVKKLFTTWRHKHQEISMSSSYTHIWPLWRPCPTWMTSTASGMKQKSPMSSGSVPLSQLSCSLLRALLSHDWIVSWGTENQISVQVQTTIIVHSEKHGILSLNI